MDCLVETRQHFVHIKAYFFPQKMVVYCRLYNKFWCRCDPGECCKQLLHYYTVSQWPLSALLMRENKSHCDVSAVLMFMQHNTLATTIHICRASPL